MFAPYVDICAWPTIDVSHVSQMNSYLKNYILSFIVADPKTGGPSWGGYYPITSNTNEPLFYKSQLNNLKAIGGNAIASFGGANGID